MRIEELMIGDWVQVFGREFPSRIIGIDSDNFVQMNDYSYCKTEDIDPLFLTPEILEKLGFIRDPRWHHCDIKIENFSVCIQLGYANKIEYVRIRELGRDNCVPSEKDTLYLTRIKYFHELQHALRLCGIEKEIKL